ncbi:hypothetical protein N7535_002476 [Penicillium sp. DV-2018c]|nr:hypothetical protein N7535_002476 [Penicillium sp. DV-2018c]
MPSRHCSAHTGLPKVWLGWGELGNRKAQLDRTRKEYFKTHSPDFTLLHSDSPRGCAAHKDVLRRSTLWFDFQIDVTKNKHAVVLPDFVRYEQLPSLLHFFYTGDYSVDEADMSYYSVPPCPGDCVTCPQICQLLRVHLAMFQTALLLRITDLQALAFRRFRDLMDTAPIYVLRFAVHTTYSRRPIPDGTENFALRGLKGITDYRPELVLPAILRYCGYYRLNPRQVRRRWKKPKQLGEKEFTDLRRQCPKFDQHLTRGIWLDMVDITVPTIQFPGESEPIRSMHPYLYAPLSPQLVNPQRSNYQYVTYLQPLPFKPFSEQELAASNTSPSAPLSRPGPSAGLELGQPLGNTTEIIDLTTDSNLTTEPNSTTEPSQDLSFDDHPVETVEALPTTEPPQDSSSDDYSLFGTPDETVETLPEVEDTAPVDMNQLDWSGADLPDIDFSLLLDDSGAADPSVPFDWPQPSDTTVSGPALPSLPDSTSSCGPLPTESAELDLGNMDFTQLLNDNSANLPDATPFEVPDGCQFGWTNSFYRDRAMEFAKLFNDGSTDLPDGTSFDWTNPTDTGAVDVDFTQFLNDDAFQTTDALGISDETSFDYSMPAISTDEDTANTTFTQLLGDDSLDSLFTDTSCLELPMDMDLEMSYQNSMDVPALPHIDFTGLDTQDLEPVDLSFLPPVGASAFPQEIQFLPQTYSTQPQASAKSQYSFHSRGITQSTRSLPTPTRGGITKNRRQPTIRRATVTATRKGSSVSSYRNSARGSVSRYNLRNRESKERAVGLDLDLDLEGVDCEL